MELKTNPDKGWSWVVMISSFGVNIIVGCFTYSTGIIHNAFLDKFEESVAYTSWAGAVFLLCMSSNGPITSAIIQKFNCRITTMIGGLLITVGCFVSGFVPSLYLIIIFFSVIGGFGAGMTYTTSVVVVGFNFREKRSLANGIAVSGSALGTFLFPPVLSLCNEYYGYTGLLITVAGISLQNCFFGALFRPSILEKESKENVRNKHITDSKNTVIRMYLHLFQNQGVVLIALSFFFHNAGIFAVYLHLPHYAITKNTSPLDAAFLISIAGVIGFCAKILTGAIANSKFIKEIYLYIGSLIILGVFTCLFPLYSSTYTGKVIYAVILGLFSGNSYAIINSINITLAGIDFLAPVYGLEMVAAGTGCLIGPVIAGAIVDSWDSYEPVFIVEGSFICVSGVLAIFTLCTCDGHGCQVRKILRQEYELEVKIEEPKKEISKIAGSKHDMYFNTYKANPSL